MKHNPLNHVGRAVSIGLVLLLPGCSTWKPLREPLAASAPAPGPAEHVLIHRLDGTRIELELHDVTPDSLRGWAYGTKGNSKLDKPSAKYGRPIAIARADVAKIESRQKDGVVTSLLVLGVVGVVAAAAVVVAVATMDPLFN